MTLLRDDPDFGVAIQNAAVALGELPQYVEKDYWVTQVIRTLAAIEGPAFVLKGGTSLSKGYAIISRFSEDVDALLTRDAGQSAKTAAARLQSITETVAGTLDVVWQQTQEPGFGQHPHRGDSIIYRSQVPANLALPITADAVLLETRIGDGQEPAEVVTISPIIARWSGVMAGGYQDLDSFRVRALEPRRTMIEKLVALHHAVSTWDASDPPNQKRFGRHYYDIYQMLEHQPTLDLLVDRERFSVILADVERISEQFYDGFSPRPAGGFAASLAFAPPRASPVRSWLEESYRLSMELLADPESGPSFGKVLKRVAGYARLL